MTPSDKEKFLLLTDAEALTVVIAGEARGEADKPVPTYRELRAKAYPPAADYLDGIVKGDTAQVQKYIDDCLAVKAMYPKA